MTAFLSPGGGSIGGGAPAGTDTRALQAIDSSKKSFANKDLPKNIAYLNNSVDVLSQWSQKLQSGVDQANENAIEQIQGFAGDLFVVFAGLEPTGINLGDLKYVLQGIGSFFGINPDTPFPMNLVDAALHFFSTYIVPLDQFTDVIFDAIFAWAEDLGLSPEFISTIRELLDAVEQLGATFYDLFDSLSDLLGAFGFLGFTSTSGLGDVWDSVLDIVTLITTPLKPVLAILGDLGIPFIQALTAIVQGANAFLSPLSVISGAQVKQLGPNITPLPSNDTTVWSVAASNTAGWIFDNTQSASTKSPGSFSTLGTGTAKRLVTQGFYPCEPGQKFAANAALKWIGIPSLSNDFGIQAVWYTDANEISTSNISIASGHGSIGGWSQIAGEFTVPVNANRFRIGIRVGGTITGGQVWVDDVSVNLQGEIGMSLVSGLVDFLQGLLPFNFFDGILGGNTTPGGLFSFFTNLLSGDSPLFAGNIFGFIPPQLLQLVGLGNISNVQPNLITAPGFDTADVINLGTNSYWSPTEGKTTPGCFYFIANGVAREIVSNEILVGVDQKVTGKVWCKWSGIVATGPPVISININRYMGSTFVGTTQVAVNPGTPANQTVWQQLSGTEYTIPGDCDRIKLSLRVGAGTTSGTVYFDDAELKKTGQIQQGWVAGLLDSLGGLGDFIQGIIDAVLSVIRGIPFVGGTLADMFENFTGQTHTIISTAATTTQILAALGSGNTDSDDFERLNVTNLGPKWSIIQNGAGTLAIPNSHDASFLGAATADFVALSDRVAASDNQIGTTVFATGPSATGDIPFVNSLFGRNDIWLRCTPFTTWATRTGLRCRIDVLKNIWLSWFLNGVETVLYTGTFGIIPVSGAAFSLEAGVGANARRYVAKLNGTPLMDFPKPVPRFNLEMASAAEDLVGVTSADYSRQLCAQALNSGRRKANAENVFEAIKQFRTLQDEQVSDVRVAVQENITKQDTDPEMVTPETVGAAVGNQTDTILANVAAITALQQVQLGNNNSGVSAIEPFEYVNLTDLDPSLWDVVALEGALTAAKIAVVDGHNAGMELISGQPTNPTVTQLCRYIGPNRKTLTDYQRNGVVVAAEMQTPGFFDGRVPSTDVYARISDDKTKWVRYRWFTNGIIRFEYQNGGAITQLGADFNSYLRPPVGSQIFIEAGIGGTPRAFRLAYNNQFYLPITDGSNVTGLGSDCRGTGFGQRVDGGLYPGKYTQFSMADNKPADTRGVGFRAFRSSTSGIATPAGDSQCPAGTFDVVDRITPDMSWDGKSLTIGTEGWYMFPMKLRYATAQQANVRWVNSIYKTTGNPAATSIAAYGEGYTNINVGSNGGQAPQNIEMGGGGTPLYCLAGDIITPGNFTSSANNIVGDAGGLNTWFCAILLNRSLA